MCGKRANVWFTLCLLLLLSAFNDRKFGELGRVKTRNELSLLIAKGVIKMWLIFCVIITSQCRVDMNKGCFYWQQSWTTLTDVLVSVTSNM